VVDLIELLHKNNLKRTPELFIVEKTRL